MERRRPRSRRPPVNPYHQLGYALAGLGTLLAIGAGVGWMLHRYLDDVDFAMWRAALGVQNSHDLAVETARARHETASRSVSPSTLSNRTSERPIGFGRKGERVAKRPALPPRSFGARTLDCTAS